MRTGSRSAGHRNRALRRARIERDEVLSVGMERVRQANVHVDGADKVWRQRRRHGEDVPVCTVERLMHRAGLRGVILGKVVRTTVPAHTLLSAYPGR